MPCRDGRDGVNTVVEYRDNPETRRRLDNVTRLLCETLSTLASSRSKSLELLLKDNQRLKAWWENHQKEDRQRELVEATKRARALLKKKALSKLTGPERKALGLS